MPTVVQVLETQEQVDAAIKKLAINYVRDFGPLRITAVVAHVVSALYSSGKYDMQKAPADAHACIPKLLEVIAKDGDVVELEYYHPDTEYKVSSLFFPKGTTIVRDKMQD